MTEEYFVPICIKCGSRDVAEEVWGLPDLGYIQPLEAKGYKFNYRGCVIGEVGFEPIEDDGLEDDAENDDRNFNCITCGNSYTWRDWRVKQTQEKANE